MGTKRYRIGELAERTGVTIRALRHYDELGLLQPQARTTAGYREYGPDELLRLQQIVIRRSLGLSLAEIKATLDADDFDLRSALEGQRAALQHKQRDTQAALAAVERALAHLSSNDARMNDPETLFHGFDPAAYAQEAEQRWGATAAFAEAAARTQRYNAETWAEIHAENAEIMSGLAAQHAAGHPPHAPAPRALAQRHREHLDRWYYPCSAQQHVQLADLYAQDSRFAKNIDKHGDALTPYLVAAIRANAATP